MAVLALIAVRAWTSSRTTQDLGVPSTTPSAPAGVVSAGRSPAPWPTAPGACGALALLPLVSSVRPVERTGIRVLLGGDRLRMVDFDTGRATALSGAVARAGEYVAVLAASPATTYSAANTCNVPGPSQILRIGADHQITVVRSLGPTEGVLTDRSHAWIVSYPDDSGQPYGTVTPLDGGPRYVTTFPTLTISDDPVGTTYRFPGGTTHDGPRTSGAVRLGI